MEGVDAAVANDDVDVDESGGGHMNGLDRVNAIPEKA